MAERDNRTILAKALARLDEMQAKLDAATRARREPIAIVGIGCRFPGGANDPEAFWRLLGQGVDAVREVPRERWDLDAFYDADPDAPGKMYTRSGGFLDRIDDFDAAFFGISPREAENLDPQHRLLLEVSWEALENAGQAPERLTSTRTGVFAGVTVSDYMLLLLRGGPQSLNAYHMTGNHPNFASGRIAHILGLQGPAMAIDSACSSSLVAVHIACLSLRAGDCDMALAGGVNVMLSPEGTVVGCKARMLSPDGRCKTFDARADGFGRGEGCGVVVLKRLSDAEAARDPILSIIRGSAVNQDGPSSGLTVPNAQAQQALLRDALAAAGIESGDVGYVEAHGTGTPLGDPIEVRALAASMGPGHSAERPLLIGSVKTNLGHLESAAGIAGLIKTVLTLQHGEIPPHLHLQNLNPRVDWANLPLAVPTERTPWPLDRPRIAGISSFGGSGTNAHAILEAPPHAERGKARAERPRHLLALSAKTPSALGALAGRYARYLEGAPEAALADVAYTANTGRSHFAYRVAVQSENAEEMRERLDAFSSNRETPGVAAGRAESASRAKVAFLFTGQGAQFPGMGRGLYETEPTFRKTLERCDALLRPHLERSLLSVLYPKPGEHTPLDETAYTQPALFALEVALAELWRSWGVEPSALLGHSVGEYAAACVAGVYSLEDGLGLIARRARLMQEQPAGGAMAAAMASEERVRDALAPQRSAISLAAVNGPESVVISGPAEAIEAAIERLDGLGIRARRLNVSHAFHSALMEPALAPFEDAARAIQFRAPALPLVSNVTGRLFASREVPDAAYWRRHLREPVQFASGMEALRAAGCRLFVEIGPSATLLGMGRLCVADDGALWTPSLRAGREDWEQMLESLGALYVRGVEVDWEGFDRDCARRRMAGLPTYPFERKRYWMPSSATCPAIAPSGRATGHPLLGARLSGPLAQFESRISTQAFAFLADHRFFGRAVMPMTAYIEMAFAAATEAAGTGPHALEDVVFREPLTLPDTGERTVQTVLRPMESGTARFEIYARAFDEPERWTLLVDGKIRTAPSAPESAETLETIRARCGQAMTGEAFYAVHAKAVEAFGPAFRAVRSAAHGESEALGWIELDSATRERHGDAFGIHPALLDACVHMVLAARPVGGEEVCVPFGLDRCVEYARALGRAWSHARVRADSETGRSGVVVDLSLFDAEGGPLARIEGLRLRPATAEAFEGNDSSKNNVYEVSWLPAEHGEAAERPAQWLIFCDAAGVGRALAERLRAHGVRCLLAWPGEAFASRSEDSYELNPLEREHYENLLASAVDPKESGPWNVVHLWSLDMAADAAPLEAQERAMASAMALAQSMLGRTWSEVPRLWFVTQGAAAAQRDVRNPLQAPLGALRRTLAREHPELPSAWVDLDPADARLDVDALLAEMAVAEVAEPEIAYRAHTRFVSRLVRIESATNERNEEPVRLETTERGVLESLAQRPAQRRAPQPGEVEIRVRATGLNFRDVLSALGVYEGAAGALGSECAGVVERVGAGVERFRVGDAVLGLVDGAFATFAMAPASLLAPKPPALSFDEAATIPIAFLTAAYALENLGKMREGDRVLIHAGAGGVGMAAVQLARRAGAEVFATAGSPEKRALLEALGVRHVMHSRTLDFADQIQTATNGQGVDLVLNSLTGDFIEKSFSALGRGGRFVEIGKAGIWSHEQVAAYRPDVLYHTLYLGDVAEANPDLIGSMLGDLLDAFADGSLRALPLRAFDATEATEAFRYMAQTRHVGKIIVRNGDDCEHATVRPDGAYLVTGGLGGIGLRVADWLAQSGARHIVLVGRSEPSKEALERIAKIEASGARVRVERADVARRGEVERVLASLAETGMALRGVVHAAGILEDAPFLSQSRESLGRVLAPKVAGAWHLDALTRAAPLDFFLLFSAAATLLGNPGQSNYAAANAFLDALALHRRARGLPALSIAWGAWAEVGMAAGLDEALRKRMVAHGMRSMSPEEGIRILDRLVERSPSAYLAVLPIQWPRFFQQFADGRPPRFFDALFAEMRRSEAPHAGQDRESLTQALAEAPRSERPSLLRRHVARKAAQVLGLDPAAEIDPLQPLQEVGLDSLMAVELRNALASAVGRALPATLLFDSPTLNELTAYLSREVPELGAQAPEPEGAGDETDDLSDEEAEEALRLELDNVRKML